MSDITALAGQVAGIVTFAAYIFYAVAILSKGAKLTKPNRATWIIWGLSSGVIAASSYASGVRETLFVPLCDFIGSFIIVVCLFRRCEGGWTWFDRWCLAGAGLSGLLWWWFNTPLVALFMNIAIDTSGALPTIQKSCREPDSEDRTTWGLFFLGSLVNMFAINKWTWETYLYPVSQLVSMGLITWLLFRPKRIKQD